MGGSDTDEGRAVVGALAGRTLTQLCVGPGDLQLRWDDGSVTSPEGQVHVDNGVPQPPYGVTAGARVVCLPGGGLAVWSSGG